MSQKNSPAPERDGDAGTRRSRRGRAAVDVFRSLTVQVPGLSTDVLSRVGGILLDLVAAAGFKDASHFTRTFKNRYGLRPRDYRAAPARRNALNAT